MSEEIEEIEQLEKQIESFSVEIDNLKENISKGKIEDHRINALGESMQKANAKLTQMMRKNLAEDSNLSTIQDLNYLAKKVDSTNFIEVKTLQMKGNLTILSNKYATICLEAKKKRDTRATKYTEERECRERDSYHRDHKERESGRDIFVRDRDERQSDRGQILKEKKEPREMPKLSKEQKEAIKHKEYEIAEAKQRKDYDDATEKRHIEGEKLRELHIEGEKRGWWKSKKNSEKAPKEHREKNPKEHIEKKPKEYKEHGKSPKEHKPPKEKSEHKELKENKKRPEKQPKERKEPKKERSERAHSGRKEPKERKEQKSRSRK